MLHDLLCHWTSGHRVGISPPLSGLPLCLVFIAQGPPTLGPTSVSVPNWEAVLGAGGQHSKEMSNVGAHLNVSPYPPGMVLWLVVPMTCSSPPWFYNKVVQLLSVMDKWGLITKNHQKTPSQILSIINPNPRVPPAHVHTRPVQDITCYRALICQNPIWVSRWGCSSPLNTKTWRRSWVGRKSGLSLLREGDNFSCVWLPKV